MVARFTLLDSTRDRRELPARHCIGFGARSGELFAVFRSQSAAKRIGNLQRRWSIVSCSRPAVHEAKFADCQSALV